MDTVESIILNTLPQDITDAIYIFGSYGTEFFDEAWSDIDIAWFANTSIDYSKLCSYEFDLCEKLGREVDLVIPDKSNIYFLVEILKNRPLVINSEAFTDWLDRFNDWVLDEYKFIDNFVSERCDTLNKINIKRLEQISLDMRDCLNDMNENLDLYDVSDEIYKKFLEQSFRSSLVQYKELCLAQTNSIPINN